MNILYYGVFDGQNWRSEYPMADGLEQQGHTLFRCNFRAWWGRQVAPAWRRHGEACELVFLQNGIPFAERHLQAIQGKPLVFLASEFALSSAQHVLDSARPPDLVLAHSEQTFRYCENKGIPAQRVHLAYNPAQYRLLEVPYRYDVCFIGGMTPRRRAHVEHLKRAGYSVYAGKSSDGHAINRIYNQSRIVLHIHAQQENYVPIRLFEVMPTQGCLLIESMGSNYDPALGSGFFESFASPEEMLEQVKRLLGDETLRQQRVQQAQGLAPQHSWQARMREYSGYFAETRARYAAQGPTPA